MKSLPALPRCSKTAATTRVASFGWSRSPDLRVAYIRLIRAGHRPEADGEPIPAVDHDGLQVEWAQRQALPVKLAYVTPANQFPLGGAMSLERRLALLHWAGAEDAWIIEDEYDAEYRYDGRPLAALQSLDQSDCVIYIGTLWRDTAGITCAVCARRMRNGWPCWPTRR